jgi:predicted transcriptional regulator
MDLVTNDIINTDEFYILLCIVKRINRKNTSFPSRMTLMSETKFGKTKVSTCLSKLERAGLIQRQQREIIKNGKKIFSTNLYTIKTSLIGIYINVLDEELLDEDKLTVTVSEDTQTEDTQTEDTQNRDTISINKNISIKQDKVLKKIEVAKNNKFNILNEIDQTNLKEPQKTLLVEYWNESKKGAKTKRAFEILIEELNQLTPELQIKALKKAYQCKWASIEAEWFNKTNNHCANASKTVNVEKPTPSYVRVIQSIPVKTN